VSPQVAATPLPKREDQERMVDSIHRAAKQRRPRLSIGSGRTSGGSAMAMKKAMFARNQTTDEERASETDVLMSPLNTSGGSSDGGGAEDRWGAKPGAHGMELSPLREMTAQFTLNLGLFSPFGGMMTKGGPTAGAVLPPFGAAAARRRAPAFIPSPSPSPSSPAHDPFATDPLSFMDSFSVPAAGSGERKAAKPAFRMEDDEAWLMKEDSFVNVDHHHNNPLQPPLQTFATFSTLDYGREASLQLGADDVLAQLDDLGRDDDDDERGLAGDDNEDDLNGAVSQDVLGLVAHKLTSSILREDRGWQEEALDALSVLDDLGGGDGDDGDDEMTAGERTERFSTSIAALRHALATTQAHDFEEMEGRNNERQDDEEDSFEADFDELADEALALVGEEEEQGLEAEPTPELYAEGGSVETIRGSVREEAKKKRISLGFDLRELESDNDDEENEEEQQKEGENGENGESSVRHASQAPKEDEGEDVVEEEDGESEPGNVDRTVIAANNEEDEEEEEGAEGVTEGEVNWSMTIESEDEEEGEASDDEEEEEGDEEEHEGTMEVNIGAEIEKAGGIEEQDSGSSHADETALGDYSVLDITFKPPRGSTPLQHSHMVCLYTDLGTSLDAYRRR
jgi:hypothetical protein